MWQVILPILLFLSSVFLVLLVLIQRGRGGGLAGAFGGLGGQSAFGTKAGDLFTRITIGAAAFWIILCAASVKLLGDGETSLIDPSMGNKAAARDAGDFPQGAGDATAPATDAAKESSADSADTKADATAGKAQPAAASPAEKESTAPEPASSKAGAGAESEADQ